MHKVQVFGKDSNQYFI